MRIFLTGATGFVGSAIVPELVRAGHSVLGLTRSDEGERFLRTQGADAHRGDLDDLESLRRGAAMADGVIHAAFDHDFSKFSENCERDRLAVLAIGEELMGSDRLLIVTSGLPLAAARAATENDMPQSVGASPRVSEQTALSLTAQGVRASVVRMSQVHDRNRHGLATYMIDLARRTGVSGYVGSGHNRWSAVHRFDAAAVYRLAMEDGSSGARYHAVAEEGVTLKEIAEEIGRGLGLPVVPFSPEDAAAHFGWLAVPVGMDAPATSAITQDRLGWHPTLQPDFLNDLARSGAFEDREGR